MKLTSWRAVGFTLIEIMAALAIILIISVFAVPTMKTYMTQSKIADVLSSVAGVQSLVNENIADKETVVGSGNGLTLPSSLGRFVESYSVSANGVINITTTSSAYSVTMTLTPSYDTTLHQVSWTCAVTDASFNDYVPDKCRI